VWAVRILAVLVKGVLYVEMDVRLEQRLVRLAGLPYRNR
jgi:hypothetical protein